MPTPEQVKVLIVDDERPVIRELTYAFEVQCDEKYHFAISSAASRREYEEQVVKCHFDVLIVDLKLDRDVHIEDDGMSLIPRQTLFDPDTIVLVHSAFAVPGVDAVAAAVEVCVLAMRAGARDCVKKSEDSCDHVVECVLRELRMRNEPFANIDIEWWTEHQTEIMQQYGGSAVAIVGNSILASAPTVPELRDELKKINAHNGIQGMTIRAGSPTIVFIPWGEADANEPV